MSVSHKSVFEADRRQLATLLDVSSKDDGHLWRDDELGAILRHQLSAPLYVDLINCERGLALKVRNLAESLGLTLKSFGDLLAHPSPPLELLKITKDFAKACRLSPRSPIPCEIASVLYFACIAAALVRCRRRITSLSDETLTDGLRWVLGRRWLEEPTRILAGEALRLLCPLPGERHD